MIGKIILCVGLVILFIATLYGSFCSIRKDDKSMALICAMGNGITGFYLGFVLGMLLL